MGLCIISPAFAESLLAANTTFLQQQGIGSVLQAADEVKPNVEALANAMLLRNRLRPSFHDSSIPPNHSTSHHVKSPTTICSTPGAERAITLPVASTSPALPRLGR